MISIKKAIELYYKSNPSLKISGILETDDEWIISAVDRESGMEIDASPLAISKNDGKITVFFPPMHAGELEKAKILDLKGLNI